jgi:EmrB/QacA subfamily drug resistance transporter
MMRESMSVETAEGKRFALFITTLAAFMSPFAISSVNIALPSIGKEFQMDAILLSWVGTAYVLTVAVFLVPFGKISDIYGRKRIFTYGITVFVFGSLGSALSNGAVMLLCFRTLQGIGAAAIYCIGAAILSSIYPSRELGRVLGINVAAVYTGTSLGPLLGGYLTSRFGWRSIFFINVFLGAIVIVFIFWKLKGEWREEGKKKFDLAGSIIYIVALLLIMYGFSHLSAMPGVWLILAGAAGMFAFLKWETKIESPVVDISLFRNNRVLALSSLATLTNYCATFAVTFLLSLYLQYIKNLTPEHAGLIMLPQPVMQAIFSPIAGRVSDRLEPRIVASVGMALTCVGLILLVILNETTSLGYIAATLTLFGFGYALFSVPTISAVMSSVENKDYGVASGMLGTMRGMGMVLSMGITILIFSLYIGDVQIAPRYYPAFLKSMKLAFTFFAVLCFGGIFASLARGKIH